MMCQLMDKFLSDVLRLLLVRDGNSGVNASYQQSVSSTYSTGFEMVFDIRSPWSPEQTKSGRLAGSVLFRFRKVKV
jgi:hypothetical protein